jgi:hypothetical protein
MKRALAIVVAATIASALVVSAVLWWMDRPAMYRNDQVTVNSVVFGLEKIRTPLLDEMGINCAPEPEWRTGSNEEWPETGVEPDSAHRSALSAPEQELFDCMLNCLPADVSQWEGPPLSSSRGCFEARVPELSVKIGIIETFRAVGAILKTYPQLTFFCHEAGHRAGMAAVKAGVSLEVSIPAVGDYCVHGAVHGLLDGFALTDPSLEDFDRIANICQSLQGAAPGGCTDGMGHAAWDAYEDFAMTTKACGTIEDLELRYSCDEGVLMRRYERVGGMKGTSTAEYKEFAALLRQDCKDWESVSPRIEEPGGPGAGCWAGSQYMLWEPLVFLSRSYPEERWRGVENFTELIDEMLATCASFGPTGEELCRLRDGYHVATVTDYRSEEFGPLCAMLRDRIEACVEKATQLTRENASR